jgi:hypothetical protein
MNSLKFTTLRSVSNVGGKYFQNCSHIELVVHAKAPFKGLFCKKGESRDFFIEVFDALLRRIGGRGQRAIALFQSISSKDNLATLLECACQIPERIAARPDPRLSEAPDSLEIFSNKANLLYDSGYTTVAISGVCHTI